LNQVQKEKLQIKFSFKEEKIMNKVIESVMTFLDSLENLAVLIQKRVLQFPIIQKCCFSTKKS
jgi:hypothetical protein